MATFSTVIDVGAAITFVGLSIDLVGVFLLARPDSEWVSRRFPSHRRRVEARNAITTLDGGFPLEPDTPNVGIAREVLNEHTSISPENAVFIPSDLFPWRPENQIVISTVEAYDSRGSELWMLRDFQDSPVGSEPTLEEMKEFEDDIIIDGSLSMSFLSNILEDLNQAQRWEGLFVIAVGFAFQLFGVVCDGIFVSVSV